MSLLGKTEQVFFLYYFLLRAFSPPAMLFNKRFGSLYISDNKMINFYKKTLRSEFHLSVYKATRHWKSSMLKVACLRVRRASAIENYSKLISINESFSATFMSQWIFSGVNLAKEDSWTGIKSKLLLMLSMQRAIIWSFFGILLGLYRWLCWF